ncbi:MAG TPA: hypothetical protein ENJ06_02800, partial [Phycisphaeraceae bacterium]|nr:hypothetical protein [Phycisphaeraceae bacterium]
FRIQHRGDVELALRPEFTPTLARMVAAKAASLPQPIKWFATPLHFRAERPQRGRLREHEQWNVDFVGWPAGSDHERTTLALADAEVIGCMIGLFEELGLTSEMIRLRISHRSVVTELLRTLRIPEETMPAAFALLDRREKISRDDFVKQAGEIGLSGEQQEHFTHFSGLKIRGEQPWEGLAGLLPVEEEKLAELHALRQALKKTGLLKWCDFDFGIVRGLAYYTGVVFEAHEVKGRERAVAGGGRYDNLIELFGGPSLPACGFGMGDVVLSLVLQERGLLPAGANLLPEPDVFLVSAGSDDAEDRLITLLAELRRAGIHARRSYRSTRNVGKLLKEAASSRARFALIIEAEGQVTLKNMATGEQQKLADEKVAEALSGHT